jgi:SAM-dependent methyltransferase
MNNEWKNRWDERFSSEGYAYGNTPNEFLKEQLALLEPGNILFPAEGEGRNGVYAATQGWLVSAFDISSTGRDKAMKLAATHGVSIDYQIVEPGSLPYEQAQFDAIALIYAHFPANVKSQYHKALDAYLRPGGTLIFEAFSKKHIDYVMRDERIGGPQEPDMLFSTAEIAADFENYEIAILEEKEVVLREGLYHNGVGSVIRFVGKKL